MADKIEPIFTADINDPEDMELLKKYFGAEAINKAFEEGDGHQTILENAAMARLEQAYIKNTPPEMLEYDRQLQAMWEEQAAIRRQTREPEEPKFTGTQMSLF